MADMAELNLGAVKLGRSGLALMWWQSWVGRLGIHLPWVLCAWAYVTFLTSEQGQTALEHPVERPLMAVFIVGTLAGMCAMLLSLLSDGYRKAVLKPPVVTLAWALRVWRTPSKSSTDLPNPAHWGVRACFVVLSGILAGGVLTVASISVTEWHAAFLLVILGLAVFFGSVVLLAGCLAAFALCWLVQKAIRVPGSAATILIVLLGLAIAIGWVNLYVGISIAIAFVLCWLVQKARGGPPSEAIQGFSVTAAPTMLALAIYAGGIYLVTHHLDQLVALGPHALVASGLLAMTMLFEGLVYLLLARATLRACWLLMAACVVVYLTQGPLAERTNPLLAKTPTVEYADSECARLSAKAQAASNLEPNPSLAQAAVPSIPILISAEGGGIRAAYWTAVSLEELSQAREVPLLADTVILSGVSGGSLGIATFLAAQDLPREARLPCIREFLSGDFLSPLVAGLLFLDVPRLILPAWLLNTHRGDYFEDFMARRWLALTKSDYFYRPLERAAGDAKGRVAVYLNATDALSGQYIGLTARPTDSAKTPGQLSLSALNMAVLDRLPDLRIAQAVHMSARFPYLSPNPDLRIPATQASLALFGQTAPAEKAIQDTTTAVSVASLVDGGYFDNSGLWPALRLLESDKDSVAERFVIHIVNDQTRNCRKTPSNTGCIDAESRQIKERLSSRDGWLFRPSDAIQAVRSEHSLQSLTALELAQSQLKAKPALIWNVPMPDLRVAPKFINELLDFAQWLPIHGRDLRYGGVALAWTLAPLERDFLCTHAAAIRTTGAPGIRSSEPIDRSKECSSPPK